MSSIDTNGGVPGQNPTTLLRGTGLFGNNQNVQITGSGVSVSIRPGQTPNTIEVLEIEIQIAQNAEPGPREIRLSVNGQTSNPVTFRVGDHSPQITSISPAQGSAGDQIAVTITGSHFGFNPDVEIAGLGVARTITSSSTTQIQAIFSVADTADPGDRGVNVRSRGITGTGFESVPGNSERSNVVGFDVLAANPRVEIGDIGSIEKGRVKTITVRTLNAPANHVTRLRFRNQAPPPATRPADGWKTGEARFVNDSGNDVTEIEYSGDQPQQIRIRGYERSTSKDNIKLEARFNNDSDVKTDKSFTVSSVLFIEEAECTGFDDVDFQTTLNYSGRFAYVPRGATNRIKAKIMPSGASGNFRLEASEPGITIAPAAINTTSEEVVTITASATAANSPGIYVKADDPNSLTNYAEALVLEVLNPKVRNVAIYAVTEDNDDVQRIPPGQGEPNSVAYVFSEGANNFIDTVAGGDDWLGSVPIGQRPPGYSTRSRRVFTGLNGVLETMPQGDDEMYSSKDQSLMKQYAPITEVAQGTADAVCVTSGVNQFLDTIASRTDSEAVDPSNPLLRVVTAGMDGRCNTEANDEDVLPPSVLRNPGSAENFRLGLQNYLNNITWFRQSNISFTVSSTINSLSVNYDLNRDEKLQHPTNGVPTSWDEVGAMKHNQNPPADTINVYFGGMESTNAIALGVAALRTQHAWLYPLAFTGNGANMPTAHEIGHAMGNPHTADPNTPNAPDYYTDLMFGGHLAGVNQCRVRKPQWDNQRSMSLY